MKLLLLGANGQLGSEWQHYYLDEMSAEKYLLVTYTSSQLDITQKEEVEKVLDEYEPDIIINCAAYTNVDEAEKEPKKAEQVNATAVKHLANLCAKYEIKLVHFSTDYIFAGSKSDRKKFPGGYTEDHPADPINWYGQTKWEGEQAIRASGCPHLIIRLSWLCGAYGHNFVKTMLRLADSRDKLSIVDDQLGSPTFTNNVVKNTLKLIELKRDGTYHLSSAGLISWAEFAETIFALCGKKVEVEPISSSQYPTEAKRPFFSKLNTGKIEQIDGIVIEDWKFGLKQMVAEVSKKREVRSEL